MTARRVLISIDSLLPGGAERVAVDLAATLDRSRYEPHLLVSRMDGPLRHIADAAAIPVTVLGRQRRLDRAAFREAVAHAAAADIVHSHKFAGNVLSTMIARRAGVPVIVHEHNWGAGSSRLRALVDRYYLARHAAAYLCCGQSVARQVAIHGVDDSLIKVLPNATATVDYIPRAQARRELGLPAEGFVVGMLARLRPEKGADILLAALAELQDPVHACILGDGPEANSLRELANRVNSGATVTMPGHSDHAARLLKAFDALVIPSRWEGLPLAALEAMAAGVPVLASAVGELPDLLADRRGWVCRPDDPGALADLLAHIAADPAERAQRGDAARTYVHEHHMLEAVAAELHEIYDAVLHKHHPGFRRAA